MECVGLNGVEMSMGVQVALPAAHPPRVSPVIFQLFVPERLLGEGGQVRPPAPERARQGCLGAGPALLPASGACRRPGWSPEKKGRAPGLDAVQWHASQGSGLVFAAGHGPRHQDRRDHQPREYRP